MSIVLYLLFFFISYKLLIFDYTTHHRYFTRSLPLLIAFSVLLAFLLDRFHMSPGFAPAKTAPIPRNPHTA